MTLIVTAAGREVFQASDRRVTLIQGSQSSVHSPTENKTVIFLLRDAVGVLGYTGNAYVRDQPTDSWLAGLVAGEDFGSVDFAIDTGRRRLERLKTVIWRIRSALEQELTPRDHLTICIGGFRTRRSRTFPFLIRMSRPDSSANRLLMRPPRAPANCIEICQIGDVLSDADFAAAMADGAQRAMAGGGDPLIGGVIRTVTMRAEQSQLVGDDLMGVRIAPVGRLIDWRFSPSVPHVATVGGHSLTDAFYSPWIITPDALQSPSVGTGHFDINCRGWAIRCLNGNNPQGGVVFTIGNQSRPPRP